MQNDDGQLRDPDWDALKKATAEFLTYIDEYLAREIGESRPELWFDEVPSLPKTYLKKEKVVKPWKDRDKFAHLKIINAVNSKGDIVKKRKKGKGGGKKC